MRFYIGPSGQLVFVDEVQEGLTNRLRQILAARMGTQLGRQLFRPNYGLNLEPFLQRRLTSGDRARLRQRIRDAAGDLNPASISVSQEGNSNTLSVVIIL